MPVISVVALFVFYLFKDPGESDKCLSSAIQEFREGQHVFELRVNFSVQVHSLLRFVLLYSICLVPIHIVVLRMICVVHTHINMYIVTYTCVHYFRSQKN